MRRYLSTSLIVLFVAIQVLSTLHMAAHGFDTHEHNGQICDIYLHNEQSKTFDIGQQATLAIPEYTTLTVQPFAERMVVSQRIYATAPRAPPVFS